MPFPTTKKVSDLRKTHPEYNPWKYSRWNALYEGGQLFDKLKATFLDKREIETKYPDIFQNRLQQTRYSNTSSIIDLLLADVFQDEPEIVAPEESIYYQWNKDCDGVGTDIAMLLRKVLLGMFIYGRAAVLVNFNNTTGNFLNDKSLIPTLHYLPADLIDDWDVDFHRLHYKTYIRSDITSSPDMILERWIYITGSEIAVYSMSYEINKPEPSEVTLDFVTEHDFGRSPVFDVIPSAPSMHVMNRLENPLISLFNRESSLSFSLNNTAFDQIILTLSSSDINSLYISELAAIKLAVGEKFERVAPSSAGYDALFKDVERLKDDVSRTVQGMALSAAARVQAPRQSATAAAAQAQPMTALLYSYSSPLRDVLEKIIAALKRYRREDEMMVEVVGFDEFGYKTQEEFRDLKVAQPSQEAQNPVQTEDGE